ncbi:hypothetical protein M8C17_20960 [Micromonospora sp. RHAY321]|uniref:hypothetical protein n=1 Tax=Micromonospora sp. RHAY321 TaxID=2944807 RepID=UPI00207C39BB|nr:hypothetical protein [Micromonospora sp. RHAY321]MCO1597626.1 hypothetical protein [Micromonospora sp. RHAY321]
MSDYLDILRRLTDGEGYALDADELDQACAQHADTVCALISAAATIAAADAQITTLTNAANLLCDVHADGGADAVLSMRERLDRVADTLTRALAQRDKATARLRQECHALTELGAGLITRPGDSPNPPAD